MKKILIITIILLSFVTNIVSAHEIKTSDINYNESKNTKPPNISAQCAVSVDISSGKILYRKNYKKKTAPASTTKIMTAIVTVENCKMNEVVTVSRKAANTGGSVMRLYTGQKITVLELLYGLLMRSGNDAAVALAEHVGGDISSFADLMNKKAIQLCLYDTHFVNPHGLDVEGHYTTAWDLSKIAAYSLNYDVIRKIVGTKTTYMAGRNMRNTNELLGKYPGVYGLKTGFTGNAGRCLVTAAKKDGLDIVTVVLKSPTKSARTRSSVKILDYVFNNYEYYDLVNKGEHFGRVSVDKGITPHVDIIAKDDVRMLLSQESAENLEFRKIYPESVHAPVLKGNKIGRLIVTDKDKLLFNIPLVAEDNIGIRDFKYYFRKITDKLFEIIKETD